MKAILTCVLVCSIVLSSCLKGSNSLCNFDPCAVKASSSEIIAVQDYLNSQGLTATQHCSGLFYRIDTVGTGNDPDVCSNISVAYKGSLTNGNVFDEQVQASNYFSLLNTIMGWKSGIPLIKQGGKIHLYIPPSLGYGSQNMSDGSGNVIIPANSILIFSVSLRGVQ